MLLTVTTERLLLLESGRREKIIIKQHSGSEEYNYFLAVLFPEDQLKIFDYNRVVKDLNGLSASEFLHKLEDSFIVSKIEDDNIQPRAMREFSLYLDVRGIALLQKMVAGITNDPVGDLDVTILSEKVLDPY